MTLEEYKRLAVRTGLAQHANAIDVHLLIEREGEPYVLTRLETHFDLGAGLTSEPTYSPLKTQ